MIRKIKKLFYRSMNKEIDYKTAVKMQLQQNAVLVDVRSHQEFEEGHLNGAICICVYDLEKDINKRLPNKKTIIIVYCSSGARSTQAKEILEKLGYENVYNLEGGLDSI